MKKWLWGMIFLALVLVFPVPTMARVDIGISISLPPPVVFAAPPAMVVIPETNVYAVPDLDVDIFFYSGWWWRLWEDRWYRSRSYSSGWGYYRTAPSFYRRIPSGWRNDYREHRWRGHQWDYQRIPHEQVQRNWRTWEKSRHWEKQNTWGVQGLKPQTRPQQPPQAVKPQSPVKPQLREAPKPQQSRPQSREVQPQRSQPQHREVPQPPVKPQLREAPKPQQSRPQTREVQPQRSQPQHREAPRQSEQRQGKGEKGEEERHERR